MRVPRQLPKLSRSLNPLDRAVLDFSFKSGPRLRLRADQANMNYHWENIMQASRALFLMRGVRISSLQQSQARLEGVVWGGQLSLVAVVGGG